ncbi:hypothetical protein O181_008733 [Austropuccinia psidii MF-1]|uniref:Reverse transcriptase domain-containing protein n=1 Tax=Austropuccinia psidii MF-1 TaxID=1389203 RepID=A0A9Q3BQ00_9BASI|nr:hypothetical protein [Austropuccinia psidii MF-1]
MESKTVPNTSKEDRRPERPVLKCHKHGRTSHLSSTCKKKTKINEVLVIKEALLEEIKFILHLNIDRIYTPVLRRKAYPENLRAIEALKKHIQELIQLGVLRKVSNNKQVDVKPPGIISWNNDKSRIVGDFGELNTYIVPDRYPIPGIHETLTKLSKAK